MADETINTPNNIHLKCEDWFQESKRFMDTKYRKNCRANEALYYNDVKLDLPVCHSKLWFNLSLSIIETEMPVVKKYLPTFDFTPDQQDDEQWADSLQLRKTQIEGKSKLKRRLFQTIHDAKIYGDGIICVMPDLKENPDGSKSLSKQGMKVEVQDVYTWFPAPESTSLDIRKSRYQIFATPMIVSEVKREYGVEVPPEGLLDDYRSFRQVQEGAGEFNSQANQVLLKSCFFMDEDENTYPFGRQVIWANGVLIYDAPLWEGAEIDPEDDYRPPMPYFKVSNYGTAHSLFGVGEPFLVASQTKCLNEIMSSLAESVKKTGNPVRKILTSWKNAINKAIQNIAGEQIEVTSPMDVTWETPPQIPASTFEFINLVLMLNDVVTGVHDESRGKVDPSVTAASAILALQEAAEGRQASQCTDEYADCIEDIGRFFLWILKTYDTETITLKKKTQQGQTEYVSYDPTQLSGSKFDVEVVAGQRVQTGRLADEERALNKFKLGVYGIEDYVNATSEPNKKAVIDSFNQRQGLKLAMDRQKQLNEANQQLVQYVTAVLDEGQSMKGTPEEDQLSQLLAQYPELLQTQEFQALPGPDKERLILTFAGQGQPEGQVQ